MAIGIHMNTRFKLFKGSNANSMYITLPEGVLVFSLYSPSIHLRFDGNLERSTAVHLIQSSLIIVELENVCHHVLDVDLSTVEVSNGTWETERLRERPNDLKMGMVNGTQFSLEKIKSTLISSPKICSISVSNLMICKVRDEMYLGWRPMYQGFVLIHTINHQRSSTSHIIDAFIRKLLNSSGLNNHIKSIRIVVLELLPLRLGGFPIQLDVLIAGVELFRDVHLDALVSCDDDAGSSIELEQLREDQPRWSSPEEENFDSNWWV